MEETVVLVFVDKTMRAATVSDAWALCSDPKTAGYIVDVLTEDRTLQERYRRRMDNLED